MVEAASEEYLLDQLVDLSEIADDLRLHVRVRVGEPKFDRDAQPSERRSQFVAGVGEQRLLRGEQFVDARGGGVEGPRDHRDLVVACVVGAKRARARTPALDVGAQTLEPPRQPGGQRKGREPDAARDDQHDGKDAPPGSRRPPREHGAAVWKVDAQTRGSARTGVGRREPDRLAMPATNVPSAV